MSLLAEEIVEEWLNRQGYFTLRGAKLGVHEIDLLAVRLAKGSIECRHIEVQASVRPMSYITDLPTVVQKKTGRKPKNAKERTEEELTRGVKEWVEKKWNHAKKVHLRNALASATWSRELVAHVVRSEHELALIQAEGIVIHRLKSIVADLKSRKDWLVDGAAGSHLLELVALGAGT